MHDLGLFENRHIRLYLDICAYTQMVLKIDGPKTMDQIAVDKTALLVWNWIHEHHNDTKHLVEQDRGMIIEGIKHTRGSHEDTINKWLTAFERSGYIEPVYDPMEELEDNPDKMGELKSLQQVIFGNNTTDVRTQLTDAESYMQDETISVKIKDKTYYPKRLRTLEEISDGPIDEIYGRSITLSTPYNQKTHKI